MAYSKKTWKARQGLGLNKFSIDGATPVPVINQPDSVTQQGDALSAGNLNDLEDRISNAFDDVETSKADKSEIDDLQNQIINLNTSVDTLDAIVGCEAEIENTDPSEGQSILASSRLIHHVNLLPSGEFGLVGARDVKWNQLIREASISSTTYGLTITYSDGTFTVSGTTTGTGNVKIANAGEYTNGHYYLLAGFPQNLSGIVLNRYIGTNITDNGSGAVAKATISGSDSDGIRLQITSTGVTYNFSFKPIFRDLTAIYGSGNEPTSVANVPAWMLSYTPYDAGSIVNLNPTGFSVRGINLWDEEWEVGEYSGTGQKISGNGIRSANMIPVVMGQTYYLKGSATFWVCKYGMDGTFLSRTQYSANSAQTFGADVAYITFNTASAYGNTYLHDIQICDNSLPSSVKTVYHPYNGQTVPVSISGHYVNENCYDYVTNKTVNGVLRGEVHTRVGIVDLGSLTWFSYSSGTSGTYYAELPSLKEGLCAEFVNAPNNTEYILDDKTFCFRDADNIVFFRDASQSSSTDFKTSVTGVYLQYALATEVVTYGEPLRSFSVTDYCTIEPITPQTLPNRVDVPFSVLSKSNNGLIQQIAQNTADIANHSAILSQHEARLSNLEQISGDYVTSDMQDYSTTPSGKATYALVETLKGVSRVENQLVTTTSDTNSSTDTNTTFKPVFFVYNASYVNLTSAAIADFSSNGSAAILFTNNTGSEIRYIRIVHNGSQNNLNFSFNACSIPVGHTVLVYISVSGHDPTTVGGVVFDWLCRDLTLYFNGGTVPTLAEIRQYYPELMEPRSYNAGEIVDSTYTKVESVGVNIWDETWEVGTISQSTGENSTNNNTIRSKGYIPVTPSTDYSPYVNGMAMYNIGIFYYDYNKNFLSYNNPNNTSKLFQTPSGCFYIRFACSVTYGSTYNYNIAIAKSDTALTEYHPYMTDTLTIPSVTLKGAGSVSDTLDVESGEITRRVGSYTFDGTENWQYYTSPNRFALLFNQKKESGEVLCDMYPQVPSLTGSEDKVIFGGSSYVTIVDSAYNGDTLAQFKSHITGMVMYYELATPSADTSVTPTLNNTIKTEGGGTVYTDADVDGQFTMGFLNL